MLSGFIMRHRLSKALTKELIEELSPYMSPTLCSNSLDVETKVLVALSFYAVGHYQTTEVGDISRHCIAQSSVSKAAKQVTLVHNTLNMLNKYVCFPLRQQVKRKFYRRFKMPRCLACIDGTHVAIVCPHEHEERYYNRKDYHSLKVQEICDAELNILNVDSSYPGSTHDSVIWANHPLNPYLEWLHTVSGEDLYLLCRMTPVSDPEPDTDIVLVGE